jgi:hypothetical protein
MTQRSTRQLMTGLTRFFSIFSVMLSVGLWEKVFPYFRRCKVQLNPLFLSNIMTELLLLFDVTALLSVNDRSRQSSMSNLTKMVPGRPGSRHRSAIFIFASKLYQ